MYEAGYGSSRQLYERAAERLGMTPGDYRRGGRGVRVGWTVVGCALGRLLLAATPRGACLVALGDDEAALAAALRDELPRAELTRDDAGLAAWAASLADQVEGLKPRLAVPLDLRGTEFQKSVWRELCAIPLGQTRTYREVARRLGRPRAARAVARACATNPVSVLVPCHRVIREDGGLGGYRWGVGRKQALLAKERAGTGGQA
jgi:AraC family transcriptional regulator of adaptative response/methylated-DNA-[protein]-cysteine methyltransferase